METNDKIKPGTIMNKPPLLDQLDPGQQVIVRLRASQLGPANPRIASTYLYARHGKSLFRYLAEEVK